MSDDAAGTPYTAGHGRHGGSLGSSIDGAPDATPKVNKFWSSSTYQILANVMIVGGGAAAALGFPWTHSTVWYPIIAGCVLILGAAYLVLQRKKTDKWRDYLETSNSKLESKVSDIPRLLADAKVAGAATYSDNFAEVIHAISRRTLSSWNLDNSKDFVELTLSTATKMINVEGIRACLYLLESGEEDLSDPGETELVLVHYPPTSGRSDQPRKEFDSSTPYGVQLLNMLNAHQSHLVRDVVHPDIPVDCAQSKYQTFIAAAIYFQGEELGVLMIDALEAGTLSEQDENIVRSIALLLALGIYQMQRLQDDRPTVGPIRPEIQALKMTPGN